MKDKTPPFAPHKYMAKCCLTIIYSKRPGQFVSCFCGDSFVDQSEYYIKCGGNVVPLEDYVSDFKDDITFGEDKED